MLFLNWVDYAAMMYCVFKTEKGYTCEKYQRGHKVWGAFVECANLAELKACLLAVPNAPEAYIRELLEGYRERFPEYPASPANER